MADLRRDDVLARAAAACDELAACMRLLAAVGEIHASTAAGPAPGMWSRAQVAERLGRGPRASMRDLYPRGFPRPHYLAGVRGSWWEPGEVEEWLARCERSREPKRGPGRRFAPAA